LVVVYFGVLPLVGIAANLAVVPVIGPLMGWTLVAGVVGGVVPMLNGVVHLPTTVLAGWVAGVAGWFARLPVGGVGGRELVWLAGAAAVGLLGFVAGRRWLVVLGGAAAVAVVDVGLAGGPGPPDGRHPLGTGAEVVVGGGQVVVVVDGRASPGSVLGGLRRLGVTVVDVAVARTSSPAALAVLDAVGNRRGPTAVLVPPGTEVSGVVAVTVERELAVGSLMLRVAPAGPGRLEVGVSGSV
jgi:hypothetical protein